MDDALAVGRIQRLGNLDGDAEGLTNRNGRHGETFGQRVSLEQLHHEKGNAVLLADVVERADVGVAHAGNCARFSLEAIELRVVDCACRRQDLDGDGSIEACITRAIDLAHATGAKSGDDFVGADPRAGVQAHGKLAGSDYRAVRPRRYERWRAATPPDSQPEVDGYGQNTPALNAEVGDRPCVGRRAGATSPVRATIAERCNPPAPERRCPVPEPRYPRPGARYPVPGTRTRFHTALLSW